MAIGLSTKCDQSRLVSSLLLMQNKRGLLIASVVSVAPNLESLDLSVTNDSQLQLLSKTKPGCMLGLQKLTSLCIDWRWVDPDDPCFDLAEWAQSLPSWRSLQLRRIDVVMYGDQVVGSEHLENLFKDPKRFPSLRYLLLDTCDIYDSDPNIAVLLKADGRSVSYRSTVNCRRAVATQMSAKQQYGLM